MKSDRILARLGNARHGVFTRGEASSLELSASTLRRWVRDGVIEELLPDTYRIASTPRTPRQELVAAQAWSEPSAASHRAAAAELGIEGFEPGVIEVTTQRRLRSARSDVILHYLDCFPRAHIRHRDGLAVTSPELTLLGLAAVCDQRRVDLAIDDVLRRRMTTLGRLSAMAEGWGRRGRDGTQLLKQLLSRREANYVPFGSVFERRVLRLLVGNGLPRPQRQFQVPVRAHKRYIDLAYPKYKVGIEPVGFNPHSGRGSWEEDQARHNELTMLGWRIVYVTYWRFKSRPGWVVEEVIGTLRAAGCPI